MRISRARRTQALVDLGALESNLQKLRALLPASSFYCPMVKANAYGHGDVQVARVCEDIQSSAVGVALYSEGIRLRESGIQSPILVFEPGAEYPVDEILNYKLTPVVSSLTDLQRLKGHRIGVHLKFNTGMNRLGFRFEDLKRLQSMLAGEAGLEVEGVCSHLSHGHDVGLAEGQSANQIPRFEELRAVFSDRTDTFHFWNSSGLIAAAARNPEVLKRGWGARPGIAIYGSYTEESIDDPMVKAFASRLGFRPVMRLEAYVTQAYPIKKGEIVSYGGTWKAERDSIIAVLSLGYADGYFRHFSNRGSMLFKQKRVRVIGRVCMDYTMLDVTDIVDSADDIIGEQVTVFGDNPTAEECASFINTISYEVFTSVTDRVPRVYLSEGA